MITPSSRPISNFYPRPLRGGRLLGVVHVRAQIGISIHALCEEGDLLHRQDHPPDQISIHALCEEGDVSATSGEQTRSISIHALCEEGDRGPGTPHRPLGYFYPRPLRGGRPPSSSPMLATFQFLSTPSARRATGDPHH